MRFSALVRTPVTVTPNIGFKLDKKMFFFDRKGNPIEKGLGRATERILNKFGAYTRQTARRSMRPARKGPWKPGKGRLGSEPGKPPRYHRKSPEHPRGPLLRDRLFYAWDALRESVVVGPEALRGSKHPVPRILEFGGFVTMRRRVEPTKKRTASGLTPAQKAAYIALVKSGRIKKPKAVYTEVVVPVEPRPFMAPALDTGLGRFHTLYGNSLKR